MLKNSLEAEEVVQDSFVKLWQAKERGKKQSKAWLYQVAKNQCLDLLRRRQHEMKYQQHSLLEERVARSACDELINTELSQHISDAIDELKEPYKSLIVLREISQLSYQQLAEVLDLNVQQIKVYLHRARKTLKQKLMEL
ncbi:MAG: RNA polymerase sigma factor [Alcanivoracaceae bacterium]|nr:RNA polymerase sigma factor [Alcanivoracaceae bacterium]